MNFFNLLNKESWKLKKIPEISELNPSKSEIKNLSGKLEVSFLPMKNLDDKEGKIIKLETKSLNEVKLGYTFFKNNDVLFAKITPCMENGKAAIVKNLKNNIGFGSTEFHVIRPDDEVVIPEWIYYFLRQKSFRNEAEHNMTGSVGQQRVPKHFLENFKIPIPSISEQEKIIRKIIPVFNEIKQLKKIQIETLDKIQKIIPSTLHEIFSNLEKENCMILKLGDIANETQYGLTRKSSVEKKGVLYIRITDINSLGKLSLREPRYVEVTPKILKQYKLKKGDILIARSGATAGKSLCFDSKVEAVFASYLIRFQINKNKVNPKFLSYFLRSPKYWTQLEGYITFGLQPNVNANNLKKIEIPIPSLNKQDEIINHLDKLEKNVLELQEFRTTSNDKFGLIEDSILNSIYNTDFEK